MATITTTTATSQVTGFPHNAVMDLNVVTSDLWIVFKDQANRAAIYKSTDDGVSWGSQGTFTIASWTIEQVCSMRIDSTGNNLHMVVLATNDGGSTHVGMYKRVPIPSGTADLSTGTITFAGQGSGQVGGELIPVANPDGSYHIFIAFAQHGATSSGVSLFGVTVRSNGTTFINNTIVGPTRTFKVSGDDTNMSVTCDLEHNGDGITSATPNIWVSWLKFTHTYVIRCSWKGYKAGWQTPSTQVQLNNLTSDLRDNPAVWDGTRYLIARPTSSDPTKFEVIERNANNTADTARRTAPAHPQGTLNGGQAISYNYITKDFRLFSTANGAAGTVYYIDYVRLTNTWGAWTLTGWPTNTVVSNWGVRRGTYGTAQYDAYTESGAGTPWTVANQIQAVNFAPTAPDWITGTAGTVTQNGAAFDVSASLLLDWNFHDPNPLDVQGSYAVQRQIGAASPQWWRVSDSTWQALETFNTSATTALTLAAANWLGAGGASDPAHVYKVATKDSGALVSPYSAGLAVVPSTRVDPTVTAPTAAQILNVGNVNVTWTVTEQSAYRVTLINTVSGATVHTSGFLTEPVPTSPTILSYTIPVTLPDGFAGQVQFTTKNVEGLSSVTRTVNFTVDFVEPVAPIVTPTADATAGGIDVAYTQAAASGAQPSTLFVDLYRRVKVPASVTVINTNPSFETNATDWTSVSYSTIARSTAQFHAGVASLLCTPTGAAATPKAQTTTLYAITPGSRYEFRGWLRSTTTNKTMRVYIDWYTAGGSLISSTTRDMTSVATTWIWAWVRGTAPDTATQARIAVGQLATPAAGDTMFADDLQLLVANDDAGIRIVAGAVAGTTYLDWRAVTGVDYEYQGYAEASNGTSVSGPWQP